MGGVDRGDQLRGYYNCKVKSRKFYKYIFYFLLDVSITNAFILYKNFRSSPTFNTIKKFRLQLARELIGGYTSWVDIVVLQRVWCVFMSYRRHSYRLLF